MQIKSYYDSLWDNAVANFSNNQLELDKNLEDASDNRFGLTVVIRPPKEVRRNICNMLSRLQAIEPDQYYYPDSDMHVTVLSVVSCYPGFSHNSYDAKAYRSIVQESLATIPPFNIRFKGITATSACVMMQGFPDDHLNVFRDNLRKYFQASGLQHSIDDRYSIFAAHSTVVRFKKDLQNPNEFLNILHKYRQTDFGNALVNETELVFDDWYQRADRSQTLESFKLSADEPK